MEKIAAEGLITSFEAEADAEARNEALHLRINGKNGGWGVPDLVVGAEIFREDGSVRKYQWDEDSVEPLGSVKFEQSIPNDEDSPVVSVVMWLDWGAGRQLGGPGQLDWIEVELGESPAALANDTSVWSIGDSLAWTALYSPTSVTWWNTSAGVR